MFGWLRKVMWDLLHFFFEEKKKDLLQPNCQFPLVALLSENKEKRNQSHNKIEKRSSVAGT
jgi:hypothetical protein